MSFFRSALGRLASGRFEQGITCPLCEKKFDDLKAAKESGELEVLGKDEQGYIHLKHVGFCGAHIVWDSLTGKTYHSSQQ